MKNNKTAKTRAAKDLMRNENKRLDKLAKKGARKYKLNKVNNAQAA